MRIIKLANIIFESINERFYNSQKKLNEGLIITHPLSKTIKIVENNGFDVIMLDADRYKNRFFVEIDSNHGDFDKLLKIVNNLGWFCSQIRNQIQGSVKSIKYSNSNLTKYREEYPMLILLFEPKYDISLSLDKIDYLYHFTNKVNWSRIKKYGLTPKTTNKVSSHPERIYFTFNPSAAEKFGHRLENKPREVPNPLHNKIDDLNVGLILKIKVNDVPSYLRIFEDPNFLKDGCYSLNSIPFDAISIFKEINL